MPDILRIKRRTSGAPGAPGSLANAEIAYNEVDDVLYYGKGTGGAGGTATTVIPIGGPGWPALGSGGSNSLPLMDGTAASGVGTSWSRYDHVHPSDTSRLALAGGTMTGVLTTFNGNAASPGVQMGAANQGLFSTASMIGVSLGGVQKVQFASTFIQIASSYAVYLGQDPLTATEAATKQYVDTVAQGLDAKQSVRAASTANITLNGIQTVDGVTLAGGDRVLVKDQSTPANNGIYTCSSGGAWNRATDTQFWAQLPGAFCFVEEGTVNADTGWTCTVNQGGTIGTTPITWTQFSSAGTVTAGSGLTKVGNVISAVGTANRIAVGASIDIDANYVGQASITTLGTIATGTWNATTISVAKGGTGATTLTGHLIGNGTGAFTAVAQIPSTDISGLGTMAAQNANAVAITGGTIDGVTFDMGTF